MYCYHVMPGTFGAFSYDYEYCYWYLASHRVHGSPSSYETREEHIGTWKIPRGRSAPFALEIMPLSSDGLLFQPQNEKKKKRKSKQGRQHKHLSRT